MNRTARIVNIDVADIRQRTINGMPLTRDEQRWLVELTGDPLPLTEKRCYACNETGMRGGRRPKAEECVPPCPDCDGHGRTQEVVIYRIANRHLLKIFGLPAAIVTGTVKGG